jgi:hypothetical protein
MNICYPPNLNMSRRVIKKNEDEPVAKKPVAKKPLAKKPPTKKPPTKKPVAKKIPTKKIPTKKPLVTSGKKPTSKKVSKPPVKSVSKKPLVTSGKKPTSSRSYKHKKTQYSTISDNAKNSKFHEYGEKVQKGELQWSHVAIENNILVYYYEVIKK